MRQHGIRPTSNRILVLQALDSQTGPVSQKELEFALMSVDKSGVSRSLSLFHQRGLVHQIPGPAGADLWEICHDHRHPSGGAWTCDDEHAHFFCTQCGRTWCLRETKLPVPPLPDGFQAFHTHLVVTGVCSHCTKGVRPTSQPFPIP